MWTQTVVAVLWVVILFSDHALVDGQIVPSAFSFPAFPVKDGSILTSGNAVFNSSLHSYDKTYSGARQESCGRIRYKDKVRMVDKASGKVASFNTSFTFSFHSPAFTDFGECGYGMTFTFSASANTSTVGQSLDPDFGICTFDPIDKRTSNRVFAVKFDSYRSSNSSSPYVDPSDATIGLVISNKGNTTVTNYNLCANSTDPTDSTTKCLFFCGEKGDFSAWINYDSAGQTLEVRFRSGSLASGGKPAQAVLSVADVVLDEVLDEEMYVGFTSSTAFVANFVVNLSIPTIYTETHRIRAWNFNSSGMLDPAPPSSPLPSRSPPAGIAQPPERRQQKSSQVGVIAGVCAAVFGAALMGFCLFCYFKRRNKKLKPSDKPAPPFTSSLTSDTNSRAYTFKELSSITKNFSDSELLSSGAFGDVYKGTPPSGGQLVAVKRIKHNKEHGQASFVAEANSLRQIRHRNLLQLRGWCEAKEGMFLVYDFMRNGSLDKWLHPNPNPTQVAVFEGLSWNVRHSILAGVASALEYLHEDCVHCVLHRDIKSSNVMLDADFNPYLGDFGLARLVDHRKLQKTTMLAGTLGYMAPEMHYTGKATKQTDVYAFGVLVLEVVCGTTPIMLPDSQVGDQPGDFLLLERVWRAHDAGNISNMMDPRLLYQSDGDAPGEIVAKNLQVGLLCCLPNPNGRPSMRLVNQWFQASEAGSAMEFPSLPATKPALLGQSNITSMPQSSEGTSSSQWSDATRLSVPSST